MGWTGAKEGEKGKGKERKNRQGKEVREKEGRVREGTVEDSELRQSSWILLLPLPTSTVLYAFYKISSEFKEQAENVDM